MITNTVTAMTHPKDKGQQKALRKQYLSGDREAMATTLVLLLTDHFDGLEWMSWEPDVLGQEVEDDFGVEMPPDVRDKLWALVTTLTTDRFYNDPLFFNSVANALMGEPTSMQAWEPAEPVEMAWAMIEVGLHDLAEGEEMKFGDEVKAFIAEILRKEGLKPFPPLDALVGKDAAGAPIPEDLDMAAQHFQEEQSEVDEILGELEALVALLHDQKDSLQIARRNVGPQWHRERGFQ